ncbi:MAG: tRNA lysidine(34) synthetase TilS, partial [Armatimonadetes bacterium]|nr:tRNA lysidine(34) synthetase TilS [Armatimonadota bacterium]
MRPSAGIVEYLEECVLSSGLLRPGASWLLAVSGGQDSVAMLLALATLRERLDLRLGVGHVNHGLRGADSDEDEQFVCDLGERLAVPVSVERVGVERGGGMEEAARNARLAALRRMAAGRFERIALAHTSTDRAETALMNVLRGCGLEGLAAMPGQSGDLVRPLLRVTRAETAAYCAARGVEPRRDETNVDQSLLRNRVRLSLLPLLEREYRAGAADALTRLAEVVEAELSWTRPLVREALEAAVVARGDGVVLGVPSLATLDRGLRARVLREALAEVKGDLRDVSLGHVQGLEALVAQGRTGARAELPGVWAERTTDALVLRAGRLREAGGFEASLSIPGEVEPPGSGLRIEARLRAASECDPSARGPLTAHLDAAVTGRRLVVRSPRTGDRLAPQGMTGTKKLQDLLADKKIPRAEREGIGVVVTTEG